MQIKDFAPSTSVFGQHVIFHAPLIAASIPNVGEWTQVQFDASQGTYIGRWIDSPQLDVISQPGVFRFAINSWVLIGLNIFGIDPTAAGWAALQYVPWVNGAPGNTAMVAQAGFGSGVVNLSWAGEVFDSDTVQILIDSTNKAIDVAGTVSCLVLGLGR